MLDFILSFSLPAHACPDCGFGQDGSGGAFILTTVIMTAVPLIVGGSVVYLIRKKAQGQTNE